MTRQRLHRPFGFLLCSLTLVLASTSCGQKPAEPAAQKPKTLAQLQQAIQAVLNKHHVPGAGVALVDKDHVIWAGGVGKADITANREVTAETQFRVGSISKTFVTLALLKLQEEGRIDLNARLADVAPEVPVHNPWEATHPVRVVHLLEHTAGFDDMEFSEVYNLRDAPDYPLFDVFKRFPEPQNVRWPPGTRMAYSNPGYGIAGYLIEKVTGGPYDNYIREAVLAPLGMTHSNFRLTPENRSWLAQGYEANPPKPVPYLNIYLRPAGDLKSSPEELARLLRMFLNRGTLGEAHLLRPETIARMEIPQTTLAARAGLQAGYGLANYADLSGPVTTRGHDGGIDGFLSTYRYLPEQGLGYVVLINSSSSGAALRELDSLVLNYLVAGLPTPQQPAIILSEAELARFTGYYEKRNPRNQMLAFLDLLLGSRRVFVDRGVLYERALLGRRQALAPVSATQFRLEKEPEASRVFCAAEDGTQVLASAGNFAEKTSPVWPYTRLGLLGIALALMLSGVLFALVWIPRKLLGRMKGVQHLSVRLVPLLAILSLVAAYFLLDQMPNWKLGEWNMWTASLWAATWLFALFSVWGLLLSLRAASFPIRRGVRLHSLLVSLACCGIVSYLACWHLIGLRLWAA